MDTSRCKLQNGVGVLDVTEAVREAVRASGVRSGLVTVLSQHTTTAVCVNENEERLFSDIQAFLLGLVPPLPQSRWRHNDLAMRCGLDVCSCQLTASDLAARRVIDIGKVAMVC